MTPKKPENSAAYTLFQRWAADPQLAVLDTETTDLDGEIIEVAMVDAQGRVLINQRIKPTGPISPAAQRIHGVGLADLADCPTFDQVWPRLRELLWAYNVVIYNKAFDYGRICTSLDLASPGWHQGEGGPSEELTAYRALRHGLECVMLAYAPIHGEWNDYWGEYRWAKLQDACRQQGVDLSDAPAHSALGDCLATLRLIRAVVGREA